MAEEVCIGTGGWGYFSGGLQTYAKAFEFVEINTTFYRLPPLKDISRWRQKVPPSFVFSVKAPRQITHLSGRIDGPTAREYLAATATVCGHLNARWLILEYPPWREFDMGDTAALADLASTIKAKTTVCLEVRAYRGCELPPKLAKMMEDEGIVDVVDPIVQEPRTVSDQAYLRVFGKGEHNVYQPTDEELEDMDDKVSRGGLDFTVFAFHGVKMYRDAARFTAFKQTGRFPKVTKGDGLSSLDEVLREDAVFPASKDELIRSQGWKLIDLAETKRVRASVLLRQLEERTYASSSDVMFALAPSSGAI